MLHENIGKLLAMRGEYFDSLVASAEAEGDGVSEIDLVRMMAQMMALQDFVFYAIIQSYEPSEEDIQFKAGESSLNHE